MYRQMGATSHNRLADIADDPSTLHARAFDGGAMALSAWCARPNLKQVVASNFPYK